ncbi:MAG: sulfatase-like hydrolase/transferase [Muribaculaceae bacterium]|nr:sulfatase-like hydrolase/transferase [Muribaculaceae bacterium]
MKFFQLIGRFSRSRIGALVCNLALAFFILFVSRLIFIVYNYDRYSEYMSMYLFCEMLRGGVVFDLSALFYLNVAYILAYLFPLHYKENISYHRCIKWLWVVLNSVALSANLVDTVYFRFTGRRSTATVFAEFSNEGNLYKIFGTEFIHNFVLVIIFAVLVWCAFKLYRIPRLTAKCGNLRYYVICVVSLGIIAPLSIASIRGGVDRTTRPITISNANQYVDRPIEAAAVLNTPFSVLRTIGKPTFDLKPYMSEDKCASLYSPEHYPTPQGEFKKKNVVIFIVESFSRAFIGTLNKDMDGGKYKGYTPFIDSLINHSLTYTNSYANGMKSIDGMPSVLSGIPMMIEPFFVTPASMNEVSSIAGMLKSKGYYSAFFHGAPNGSMGFQAFARKVGYTDYFGLDEYCQSPRHNGKDDFDGSWAIWDYPFIQYYKETIDSFNEPFVATIFTATSHHPFVIPDEYKERFPEEGFHPILKCIRYTDESLRAFFAAAKKESWYNNTLFVITSDHSSQPIAPKFNSDQGVYAAPIIFYAPGDSTLQGYDTDKLAQQTDILPTVMSYLNYDKPYVAFGVDLLTTKAEDTFVFNYLTGIYQYTKGEYFMRYDGEKVKAVYRYHIDPELKNNIMSKVPQAQLTQMENELKAIIQQYATRMKNDKLTIR